MALACQGHAKDINSPVFTYQSLNPGFFLELVGVGIHVSPALCFCHMQIRRASVTLWWKEPWPQGKSGVS